MLLVWRTPQYIVIGEGRDEEVCREGAEAMALKGLHAHKLNLQQYDALIERIRKGDHDESTARALLICF